MILMVFFTLMWIVMHHLHMFVFDCFFRADQKPYVCHFEGCTFAARNRSPLVVHLRTHTGARFQCGLSLGAYIIQEVISTLA